MQSIDDIKSGTARKYGEVWVFRCPKCKRCSQIGEPFSRHSIVQHDDGTVSVNGSIICQSTPKGIKCEAHFFIRNDQVAYS
jgi:hypothetical protein